MSAVPELVLSERRVLTNSLSQLASAAQSRAAIVSHTERLPFLDLLRALSAHLIVWHHLVFYGPLSDVVAPSFPVIHDFLCEHGRNAVQVFFVLGGYFTAAGLAKHPAQSFADVVKTIRRRYLRIAGPYIVVLILAVFANALAHVWMDHESISQFPTIPQFLAHVVFLHSILGYEALTAGIWYLAIDFQLAVLVIALMWLAHRLASPTNMSPLAFAQVLIWPLATASLLYFNRHADWDKWAVYFLGSYALGLITYWALSRQLPNWSFWLYAGLMAAALLLEFRPRLLVALSTGLLIFSVGQAGLLARWPTNRLIQFAAASSYSLFLIHFPVCLVVNAYLSQYVLHSPKWSLAGLLAAYGLSLLASIAFYYGVERMFQRPLLRRETVTATA